MSVLGDFAGYVWYALGYLVYSIVGGVVRTTQQVTCPEKSRYDVSCHVMNIIWKRKFFLIDVVSPSDFIALHETYTNPEYVLKHNVSLYCITKNEAIFIEAPDSINIYKSDVNPFLYIGQFQQSIKVIRMPVTSLFKLTNDIGDPAVDVCYMANTGRCGSTILSQALENVPGTLLLAEPDCLTNIGHLWKSKTMSQSEYEEILVATMKILCKPHTGVERICIKTRSCATCHINAVTKRMPKTKIIFGHRNSLKTVSSFLGLMISETAQSTAMYLINSDMFSRLIPFFRRRMYFYFCYMLDCEPALMRAEDMNTVEQFAYAWANCMEWVRDFQDQGGKLLPILYEALVADKAGTCKLVFKELNIDEKYIGKALLAFGDDSQAGSPLGRSNIVNMHRRRVSEQDQMKSNEIFAKFGLPIIGEAFDIKHST